jgi:sugar phosphate isomerase/epimerase
MISVGGRAHTIDEIIQVCELNYPFVEINLEDPDKIQSQLDLLLDIKEKYGIYYLAHFPNEGNHVDLNNLATVFVPKLMKLIELCPKLGIKKGTLHFWMDKRWASEQIISKKMNMLSKLVDYAVKFKIQLCLENLTCRHDSFSRYFKQIPNLKMTMDIGHAQLLSKENTCFGFMENVFEKIAHIHVHDNLGGKTVKDDLHLPLGEGIVDYPKIFSILVKKGYQSTITMEVKPHQMAKVKKIIEKHIKA